MRAMGRITPGGQGGKYQVEDKIGAFAGCPVEIRGIRRAFDPDAGGEGVEEAKERGCDREDC